MEINGISGVQGPKQVQGVQPKSGEQASRVDSKASVNAPQDVVDVSSSASMEAATGKVEADITFSGQRIDGIRVDLVNRIRSQIEAGTYDTEEKMAIALKRMLGSFEE